jgi:hypothetical protein
MKTLKEQLMRQKKISGKKGSAIAMVLILGIALIIIIFSQLDRGVNNKQLNLMNSLYYEARNAAESFAEYGCADIVKRFETKTSFPQNELKNNPIVVPSSSSAFFTDTNVDLTKTEVKGGIIEAGYWVYLDPEDPRWEFDPLKGKRIFVRDVEIYAKATSKSELLGSKETSAFVRQTLQVRDSPLFADAIFYNLDLEMNPGPDMDVYGTVHSNQNIWLGVNDGSELKFHEPITATGNILHGDKEEQNYNPHRSGLRGEVFMKNAEDNFNTMLIGVVGDKDSDWLDANQPDWRTLSSQTWDGNVQDEAHNVPSYNAAGIADHVPDDPNTAGVSELENHAYAIIEPVLPKAHVDVKTDSVRNQKMAAKAGLLLRVEYDGSTETGFVIKAYRYKRSNMDVPINVQNPFDSNLEVDGNGDPILQEVVIPDPTGLAGLDHALIGNANSNISRVDNTEFASELPQPEHYDASGGYVNRGLYDHRQDIPMSLVTLDMSILRQLVDDNANAPGTSLADEYWQDPDTGAVTFDPIKDWNGVVYIEFPLENNSGSAVDKIVKAKHGIDIVTTTTSMQDVWNYVGSYNGTHYRYWSNGRYYYIDDDYIHPYYKTYVYAGQQEVTENVTKTYNLGLQIINGEFIPSPTFAEHPGLTLVTNVPMYVIGHYNADGVAHTDDAQLIEHTHYVDNTGNNFDEPPAALMADTVTLLSSDWLPANENNRRYSAESDKWNRDVQWTDLEFSAAIVTGITPTIPRGTPSWPSDGAGSGGAINLPRFLEDWGQYGKRVTIRSSLVALFESEVHTEPYHDYFNHFYIPPTRDWGFNENFANGVYPPGTPNVRAFRRTRFEDVSEAEYLAGTNF